MIFIFRCSKCQGLSEGDLESLSRLEFDFVDQEIRFVCPICRKDSSMSLLTSYKLKSKPLPGIITMRG